ncbi:MAG TPA: nickel-type superoxide dismutase maturation protease [Candidatus Limnocylindria bacterium]|jgi:nickel-type superoxide dismutase maturation protease
MTIGRGRPWPLVALAGVVAGAWLSRAARGWLDVVEVQGRSMAPTLLPGDRLLVERLTYRRHPPRAGDVVLAFDPRTPERELIKRVHAAGPHLDLRGDAPDASTDSRAFGALPRSAVQWRAAFRYWPPDRIGGLRR